jgi:hypothetical protein
MLFSQDRDQLRRFYIESWRKARQRLPMEPQEHAVAQVVAEHPEYHALLENPERTLGREYLPEQGETNPFLHMGMHLAIREQVTTNRPTGIRPVHRRLTRALGNALDAEHLMMECLGEALWIAQRTGTPPDERLYLQRLDELIKRLNIRKK